MDKAEGKGKFFFNDADKFCDNFNEGVKDGKGTYYYQILRRIKLMELEFI